MSYKITVRPDRSVEWNGIDTGKTTLMAINKDRSMCVLKIAGHSAWINSVVGQEYTPARFEVHKCSLHKLHGHDHYTLNLPQLFGELSWPVRPN